MTREDTSDPKPPMTALPLDFTAFHQTHRPIYVRCAERYLGNRQDAVDDTFLQLYRLWDDHVLAQPNPAAYAWKAMKNHTISLARKRGRGPVLCEAELFETVGIRDALHPIEALRINLDIVQAEAQLSERQREVFFLLHRLGVPATEAAAVLGVSAATIRSTDRYARTRLRQLLKPADPKGDPSP